MGLETGLDQSAATRPPPGEQKPVPAGLGDKQEEWGGLGAAWACPALPSETGVPLDPEPLRALPHALLGVLFPVKSLGQRFRESWSILSWAPAPCRSARSVDPRPHPERITAGCSSSASHCCPFVLRFSAGSSGFVSGFLAALPQLSYPGVVWGCRNPPN